MQPDIQNQYIQDNCKSVVNYMLSKLKAYSPETYNHSIDVAKYSLIIGKQAGLSQEELTKLYTASTLHDVGKLVIDQDLLAEKFTSREQKRIIQLGHIYGTKMLLEGKIDDDIFNIAYHHHERLNGTGYPQGLQADDLSDMDRILQVADVTSALTMKRSYKDAYDKELTNQILDSTIEHGELDPRYVAIAEKEIVDKIDTLDSDKNGNDRENTMSETIAYM